jgi:Tfp pilus assembly protein PilO
MDRKHILELLGEKKVQDYSFTVVFFVVFSFFVYFAIRPNLITAFSLQRELQEVKLKNREYEEQILQIVNYQSTIEQYRDKFFLLDEAIPHTPQLAKVIDDVKRSADESGTVLDVLSTEEIDFKEKKDEKLASIKINMTTRSPLSQVELLLRTLMNQRRIKTIDAVSINAEETEGGQYTIMLDIQGYYL